MRASSFIFAALASSLTCAAAPDALIANRGTVTGIYDGFGWKPAEWTPERFVRIRNTGSGPVTLDGLSHPPVYSRGSRGKQPWTWIFKIRRFPASGAGPNIEEEYERIPPITLAAGDSLDLGLFHLGDAVALVKQAADTLRGEVGDSLTVPFAIHCGGDSLAFILKTRIGTSAIIGSGIRPVRSVNARAKADAAVRPDGRIADERFADRRGWIPLRIDQE